MLELHTTIGASKAAFVDFLASMDKVFDGDEKAPKIGFWKSFTITRNFDKSSTTEDDNRLLLRRLEFSEGLQQKLATPPT